MFFFVYTLKGVGGDILICEEAAYMDLGVFYEVVMPIMEMDEACIIFITTPLGQFNFHSGFSQLRDSKGRKIINCIKVGLICKKCMEADHPEQCPHMKGRRPSWKSEDKFKNFVSVIMKDQVTLLRREALYVFLVFCFLLPAHECVCVCVVEMLQTRDS